MASVISNVHNFSDTAENILVMDLDIKKKK